MMDVICPRANLSETARLCKAALVLSSQAWHPCHLYEFRRGTAMTTADNRRAQRRDHVGPMLACPHGRAVAKLTDRLYAEGVKPACHFICMFFFVFFFFLFPSSEALTTCASKSREHSFVSCWQAGCHSDPPDLNQVKE